MMADAAEGPHAAGQEQHRLPHNADTDAAMPQSVVGGQSPMHPAEAFNSAVSATTSAASLIAQANAVALDGILSPRASLDLGLHPDNDEVCVVRITADPGRAHYRETNTEDSVIEDPTAVAVLEHAFQSNTTHPVFHVHMPSRRSSQHGHEAASEADSEADYIHQSVAYGVHQDHQLSQPLLSGTDARQSHGHELKAVEQLSLWQRWKTLLGNPEAVPFFAMSLLMGFGTGILSVYLSLYLDELGKSSSPHLQDTTHDTPKSIWIFS